LMATKILLRSTKNTLNGSYSPVLAEWWW